MDDSRIERDIRTALEEEASRYDPPGDLAHRTVAASREAPTPSWRERWLARRDARSAGGRVTGYPKWAYAAGAAAVLAAMFVVGRATTRPTFPPTAVLRDEAVLRGEPQAAKTGRGAGPAPLAQNESTGSQSAGGGVAAAPDAIAPPVPGGGGSAFPPQVIRTADVEIKVKDGGFERAWDRADQIARSLGGFVTDSSTETIRSKLARGTVTMRIPADKLETALDELARVGSVVRLSRSGNDVSGQIVDVEARLRALQAHEAQLLELMGKAQNVSETLEIRTRLNDVRMQIEQTQAQQQYLKNQVAMATVRATIYEPDAVPEDVRPAGRLGVAWDNAREATVTIMAGVLVTLGYLAPIALLAVIAWALVALVRRRRAV